MKKGTIKTLESGLDLLEELRNIDLDLSELSKLAMAASLVDAQVEVDIAVRRPYMPEPDVKSCHEGIPQDVQIWIESRGFVLMPIKEHIMGEDGTRGGYFRAPRKEEPRTVSDWITLEESGSLALKLLGVIVQDKKVKRTVIISKLSKLGFIEK